MPRLNRKDEHIIIRLKQKPSLADFSDIHFVHNCLPDRNLNEVTLETSLLGTELGSPLFINALTGGTPLSKRVNAALAGVARECGLPMALGSQMAALDNPLVEDTFKVVREVYPEGQIWANLGAYATPELARRAIEMIDAAALQIHLNVPQELAMKEGDCRFRGTLRRIEEIAAAVKCPVIIKEVGFGIAREPVSYTHLDVYKRQGRRPACRPQRCSASARAGGWTLSPGAPSADHLRSCVSYPQAGI